MKIEVHVLQNFAPSNLNRDDTNTPKTCDFGEVPRARLSSQCFKRAVREEFRKAGVERGTRSKRLKLGFAESLSGENAAAQELADAIKAGSEPKSDEAIMLSRLLTLFVETYYSKMDAKRPQETAVLLYWSEPELQTARQAFLREHEELARIAVEQDQWDATRNEKARKEQAKERPGYAAKNDIRKTLLQAGLSPDIALFGRMLAEAPEVNVDAACQVAHAISTHQVNLETDFYTAVDDKNQRDETGAGMLGVTGYSSACYYRYALLDRDQLMRNLGGDAQLTDTAIEAFLQAFVQAIPTGKQNSMAAQNRPSLGLFVVREKGVPCSLANAFARPVRARDTMENDLITASKQALASYFDRMNRVYDSYESATCALFHDGMEPPKELSAYDKTSLRQAVAAAMQAVRGEAQA